MMEQEFNIGDVVTFNPYGTPIKGKVKSIDKGYLFNNGDIHYNLTGVDPKYPLLTHTTGRSIMESKYFDSTPFSWSN